MMNRIDEVMQELWQIKDAEARQYGSVESYVLALNQFSAASAQAVYIPEPVLSAHANAKSGAFAVRLVRSGQ